MNASAKQEVDREGRRQALLRFQPFLCKSFGGSPPKNFASIHPRFVVAFRLPLSYPTPTPTYSMPACQRPSCRSLRCLCRSLCLLLAHSHFKCPVLLLPLLPCWTVSFQIHGWPGPTWTRCICNNKYAYATCLVLLLRHGVPSPQGSLHLHLGSRSLNIRTLSALPREPGTPPWQPCHGMRA